MSQKNETVYIALHLAYVREHEKDVSGAISLHQALQIVWNGMTDWVIVMERRWSLFCAAFENTICKILPYNNYLVYLHHNWDWYGKGDTRTFTMQKPIWAQRLLFCEHISHLYRSEARRSRCDKELSITCRTVRKRHSMHEKGHYKAIYAYPLPKAPGRRRLT